MNSSSAKVANKLIIPALVCAALSGSLTALFYLFPEGPGFDAFRMLTFSFVKALSLVVPGGLHSIGPGYLFVGLWLVMFLGCVLVIIVKAKSN